jgi:hypothetical protein
MKNRTRLPGFLILTFTSAQFFFQRVQYTTLGQRCRANNSLKYFRTLSVNQTGNIAFAWYLLINVTGRKQNLQNEKKSTNSALGIFNRSSFFGSYFSLDIF